MIEIILNPTDEIFYNNYVYKINKLDFISIRYI